MCSVVLIADGCTIWLGQRTQEAHSIIVVDRGSFWPSGADKSSSGVIGEGLGYTIDTLNGPGATVRVVVTKLRHLPQRVRCPDQVAPVIVVKCRNIADVGARTINRGQQARLSCTNRGIGVGPCPGSARAAISDLAAYHPEMSVVGELSDLVGSVILPGATWKEASRS